MVTTTRRDRVRQSANSFVVVCKSKKRQGRPHWRILIRSKKLLKRLKAQKHKKGIGFDHLIATCPRDRYATGMKLNLFGHCPRITLRWRRRQLQHGTGLYRLYQRKQSILPPNSELQLSHRNKTHVDIHSLQASFLHQLENAGATTTNPESCPEYSTRVGGSHDVLRATNVNSHCTYSERDIDNLFSTIWFVVRHKIKPYKTISSISIIFLML